MQIKTIYVDDIKNSVLAISFLWHKFSFVSEEGAEPAISPIDAVGCEQSYRKQIFRRNHGSVWYMRDFVGNLSGGLLPVRYSTAVVCLTLATFRVTATTTILHLQSWTMIKRAFMCLLVNAFHGNLRFSDVTSSQYYDDEYSLTYHALSYPVNLALVYAYRVGQKGATLHFTRYLENYQIYIFCTHQG